MTEDTSTRQADTVQFACPNCGVQLRSKTIKPGSRFRCPKCDASGIIPNPDDNVAAGYGLGSVPERPASAPSFPDPRRRSYGSDAGSEENADSSRLASERSGYDTRRPTLPIHPMISGLFDFFGAKEVFVVWILLTMGLALVIALLLGADALAGMRDRGLTTGRFGSVGGMLLLGLGFIFGLIWMVPAFVQCLNITSETASGNRKLQSLPDVVWIDWVQEALYVILPAMAAGVAAYAVGRYLPAGQALVIGATFLLLFPIFILSALDQQACYAVLSLRVARSLGFAATTWLIFLGATAAMAVAVHAMTLFACVVVVLLPRILLLLALPAFFLFLAAEVVTFMMIYFRLLGRLAWVIEEKEREGGEEEEA